MTPWTCGGVNIDHSEKENYLGDWIHEKGCRASISETVKVRTTGLIGKAEEIIQVSESPLMNGNGNSMAAFKLFESQLITALFFFLTNRLLLLWYLNKETNQIYGKLSIVFWIIFLLLWVFSLLTFLVWRWGIPDIENK